MKATLRNERAERDAESWMISRGRYKSQVRNVEEHLNVEREIQQDDSAKCKTMKAMMG